MTDRPVFVDPTGRRRRTVRMAAIAGAIALLGVAGLLVAALMGAPVGPAAFLPEEPQKPPAAEPQQPPATQPAVTTTSTKPRSGVTPAAADPATSTTTTTESSPTTTTTTTSTKGNKPETPPGRPTDLPPPPGHTR